MSRSGSRSGLSTLETVLAIAVGGVLFFAFMAFYAREQTLLQGALSQARSPAVGWEMVDAIKQEIDQPGQIHQYALVTTLAGNGTGGHVDGPGTSAEFSQPYLTGFDAYGDMYVVEGDDDVRLVTPQGVVSTVAGDPGVAGFADGTGTAALFDQPYGGATDAQGNLYVADGYNNRIRQVTPAGVVTTIAGNGTGAELDGTGTSAEFNSPRDIAIDRVNGDLFICDDAGQTIRRLDLASGAVVTVAGNPNTWGFSDGTGTAAEFDRPLGITYDGRGHLFVADLYNDRVREVGNLYSGTANQGVVTTFAGNGTGADLDGVGTSAELNMPHSITTDLLGNLYVGLYAGHQIAEVETNAVTTMIVGNGTQGYLDGVGLNTEIATPPTVRSGGGNMLLFGDRENNRIRKVTFVDSAFALTAASSDSFTFQTAAGTESIQYDPLARRLEVARGSGTVPLVADGGDAVVNGGTPLMPLVGPAGLATTSPVPVFSYYDASIPPNELDVNGQVSAASLSAVVRIGVYLALQQGPRAAPVYLRTSLVPR